jgi:hypothetical protein
MPRLLLDMVTAIVTVRPEMMISGTIQCTPDFLTAVKKAKADVVILSEPAGRQRHNYRELLHNRPHLKVLTIASDGRRFSLYEMRPHRAALGEISPASLVGAILSSVKPRLLRAAVDARSAGRIKRTTVASSKRPRF